MENLNRSFCNLEFDIPEPQLKLTEGICKKQKIEYTGGKVVQKNFALSIRLCE